MDTSQETLNHGLRRGLEGRERSERLLREKHGPTAKPSCTNCHHRNREWDDSGHCRMFMLKPKFESVPVEILPCGQWKFTPFAS